MLSNCEPGLEWSWTEEPTPDALDAARTITAELAELGIYVGGRDLEHDLCNSSLQPVIADFVGEAEVGAMIGEMQLRKATFMFAFLAAHRESLHCLAESSLAKPLLHCKRMAEATFGPKPNG